MITNILTTCLIYVLEKQPVIQKMMSQPVFDNIVITKDYSAVVRETEVIIIKSIIAQFIFS